MGNGECKKKNYSCVYNDFEVFEILFQGIQSSLLCLEGKEYVGKEMVLFGTKLGLMASPEEPKNIYFNIFLLKEK